MNENIVKKYELLSATVIKGLESRNISGYYAHDAKEALETALSLIPQGSSVGIGGTMSAREIGLAEALAEGDYDYIDRDNFQNKREAMLKKYTADVYITSCNAMTNDGVLVFIDGTGNRTSSIAQGPKKVILIVSMNKVCVDVDSAIKRARNVAAPTVAQRFGLSTPCTKTGACYNCKSHDTICSQILITRYNRHDGRIHVVLVGEDLGY